MTVGMVPFLVGASVGARDGAVYSRWEDDCAEGRVVEEGFQKEALTMTRGHKISVLLRHLAFSHRGCRCGVCHYGRCGHAAQGHQKAEDEELDGAIGTEAHFHV